jgi:hypothetical protein
MNKIESEIFISDIHFPYEDKLAWPLALKVIRYFKPDLVYIGGDGCDFYAVSAHDRNPLRKLFFQEEIDQAHAQLNLIRKASPNSLVTYYEGNHETRLRRFLNGNAPELAGLRSLQFQELLNLKKLDIKFIANGTQNAIGKLNHLHGNEVKCGGKNIAEAMYQKFHANIIFGHHHRLQRHSQRRLNKLPHTSLANPCLCDLQVEYDGFPQWQLGFTFNHYSKSGYFQPEQVQILRDRQAAWCMVQGKHFQYTEAERKVDQGKKLPRAAK